MVEKKSFPQSHADSCMNQYNQATADKSLIISYNFSDHYIFMSVYTGCIKSYFLLKRVRVSYDKEKNILNCDCHKQIYRKARQG